VKNYISILSYIIHFKKEKKSDQFFEIVLHYYFMKSINSLYNWFSNYDPADNVEMMQWCTEKTITIMSQSVFIAYYLIVLYLIV